MDSCACTVGVDYRVHANHATKVLHLCGKDGGEKGEIFVEDDKKCMFFPLFHQKYPFCPLKSTKKYQKFAHVKKK